MTEIYLVRHPESALNADASLVGGRSNSTPVTERGVEQSRRFATAFSTQYPQPDIYYSSPAVRAKALIDIYNDVTQKHNGYFIDNDLQEMSQGQAEGKPRSEIYTPETLERIAEQQYDFAIEDGESLNTVADRMLSWAYRTEERHPDSVVLAATHGQSIRASVGRLLGWTHYETTIDPNHQTDNVSLTHITVKDGVATVNFWGKDIIDPVEKTESTVY